MNQHFRILSSLVVLISATLGHNTVRASAGGDPIDQFVSRQGTDLPMGRYANGQLGVVLPTYPRIFLYPAWRAIVLGQEGSQQFPIATGGPARSIGRFVDGWAPQNDPDSAAGRWVAAGNALAGSTRSPLSAGIVSWNSYEYRNCPDAAFEFATATLARLRQRDDATPQRLITWVNGQDVVFTFCVKPKEDRSERKIDSGRKVEPGARMPEPLPPSEPLYWRQLQEYQTASAHFYAGNFDESQSRFTQIGATGAHPMQGWGAYLALRSRVRKATLSLSWQEVRDRSPASHAATLARSIERVAQGILADARLSEVHEATRATLRTAQFRLQPVARFHTLSASLDRVTLDPYDEDRLGDWRRLANDLIDGYDVASDALDEEMRNQYEYFDWMRTIQRCALEQEQCLLSRQHALDRWSTAPVATGPHRAWLVAALLVADRLPSQLEIEALAVEEAAPEFLTVQHNLSRLYRAANEMDKARAISKSAFAFIERNQLPSRSAINLFRAERFAAATHVDEAASYLLRLPDEQVWDPDTGESSAKHLRPAMPDSDGLAWIDRGLSIKDLLRLANDNQLNEAIRLRLSIVAWVRAELLGNTQLANQAALLSERFAPVLQPAGKAYRQAASSQERRHAFVLMALRHGFFGQVSGSPEDSAQSIAEMIKLGPRVPVLTASMWCNFAGNSWDVIPDRSGLKVTTDSSLRDREIEALGRIKTATGFVGDHVLRRARTHPSDPDLPWLLHVVIQSTRGGCIDKDSHDLSKAAHYILHRRSPRSEWAAKSPYFY